jgi:hypothetical protein
MKLNRIGGLAAALLCLLLAPPAAQAQVSTGKPIKVKPVQPKVKKIKLKGFVQNTTRVAITVRLPDEAGTMKTFQLGPQAQDEMLKIIERGGYQFGDRVTIEFAEGTDVALKVKGKPSKPVGAR